MTVDKNGIGRHDDLAIVRNPGCWGICKYKLPNQPHLKYFQPLDVYTSPKPKSTNLLWFILPPIIIFLIIIAIVIFIKK